MEEPFCLVWPRIESLEGVWILWNFPGNWEIFRASSLPLACFLYIDIAIQHRVCCTCINGTAYTYTVPVYPYWYWPYESNISWAVPRIDDEHIAVWIPCKIFIEETMIPHWPAIKPETCFKSCLPKLLQISHFSLPKLSVQCAFFFVLFKLTLTMPRFSSGLTYSRSILSHSYLYFHKVHMQSLQPRTLTNVKNHTCTLH